MNENSKPLKSIIFITSYAGNFNGRDYNQKGNVYGSELACINVAKRLVDEYDVTVFVNDEVDLIEDGVKYVNWKMYDKVCIAKYPDICIVSRYINFFLYNINYAKKTYIWSHDMYIQPYFQGSALPNGGTPLLKNLLPTINGIVCVGEQQKQTFYKNFPPDKLKVIPNGIDLFKNRPTFNDVLKNKVPNSFVFCSSPTLKHLKNLLKVFPQITEVINEGAKKRNEPGAQLSIYYTEIDDECKELAKLQPNVIWYGKVSHAQMIDILLKTDYWVYPTGFFETCCTVTYETGYCGCLQITSNVGALKENVKGIIIDYPVDSKQFENELINIFKYFNTDDGRKFKLDLLKRQYDWSIEQTWDNRSTVWHNLFNSPSSEGGDQYITHGSYKNYLLVDQFYCGDVKLKYNFEIIDSSKVNKIVLPYEKRKFKNQMQMCNVDNLILLPFKEQLENFLKNELHTEYIGLFTYNCLYINIINHSVMTHIIKKMKKSKYKCYIYEHTNGIGNSYYYYILHHSIIKDAIYNLNFSFLDKKHILLNENKSTNMNVIEAINSFTNTILKYRPIIPNFKVGCAIMMKNEESSIIYSLESAYKYVDCFIFYDTGSTDNTIKVCQDFCTLYDVPMYLKQGTFVDFEISRNVLLNFADDKADYLLLLDSADELRGGELMWNYLYENEIKCLGNFKAFYLTQFWSMNDNENGLKFRNTRLIKTKSGWIYEFPVHEYITGPYLYQQYLQDTLDIVIYQDRTKDAGKSQERWKRDKLVLLKYLRKHPNDDKTSRAVFYLAQTYRCLNIYDSAYINFMRRIEMGGGLRDEMEQSYLELYNMKNMYPEKVNREKAMQLLEELWNKFKRGEAPYFLAKEYFEDNNFEKAYEWCKRVCDLPYPHHVKLWVDGKIYLHGRYQLMAAVCHNIQKYKEGYEYLKLALQNEPENSNNIKLLEYYKSKI